MHIPIDQAMKLVVEQGCPFVSPSRLSGVGHAGSVAAASGTVGAAGAEKK